MQRGSCFRSDRTYVGGFDERSNNIVELPEANGRGIRERKQPGVNDSRNVRRFVAALREPLARG